MVLALLFLFKCKCGWYTNRTAAGLVICAGVHRTKRKGANGIEKASNRSLYAP